MVNQNEKTYDNKRQLIQHEWGSRSTTDAHVWCMSLDCSATDYITETGKIQSPPDSHHLNLSPSPLKLFVPRPNTLSQACKPACTVLKVLSCWTPMIMISCTIILLKFKSTAPLKKLRTMELSLRRGLGWFQWWLMDINIDSNKHWAAKTRN